MFDMPIVRLDPDLPVPCYAQAGDAGLDLMSRIFTVLPPAGGRILVPTGVAVALPEGSAGLIIARSGLAAKHGVTCLNGPGLIDSGYRGELGVLLINTDPEHRFVIDRGDRIAQLVVIATPPVRLIEVPSLDASQRGVAGFGSTGR